MKSLVCSRLIEPFLIHLYLANTVEVNMDINVDLLEVASEQLVLCLSEKRVGEHIANGKWTGTLGSLGK